MASRPQTCPFVSSFVYNFVYPAQIGKTGMNKPALSSEFVFGWFWLMGILAPLTVTSTLISKGWDATTCSIIAATTRMSFSIFVDINQIRSCLQKTALFFPINQSSTCDSINKVCIGT